MIGYTYIWKHKYDQHDIYVGSTNDDKVRECLHRSDCNNPNAEAYNKPFYQYVRKYGTLEQWKMTVIYEGPSFRIFEKNYIKATYDYNLNKEIPLPTEQEKKDRKQEKDKAYYKANKDKINEKDRAYKKANRDILNEKAREKITCDNCGAIVRKDGISKHKKSLKCSNFKSGNT